MDRLIQQALSQELTKMYDAGFSENSYGFRAEKNAHQALQKAKAYVNAGYTHVIDLDLAQFFDQVNNDYLMNELSKRVEDKPVLKLIKKYCGQTFRNKENGQQVNKGYRKAVR